MVNIENLSLFLIVVLLLVVVIMDLFSSRYFKNTRLIIIGYFQTIGARDMIWIL